MRPLELFRAPGGALFEFVRDSRVDQVELPPRGHIIRPGQPAEFVFTVFEGWAFRYRTLSSGARQITDLLLPGDFIGLSAQLPGGPKHGVCALSDVRLCRFPADMLARMFELHPLLAQEMSNAALVQEERLERRLLALGRQTPGQRLGLLMLEVRERLRQRGESGEEMPFPLSYEQMADAIGLSRAQLARSLADLRDRGWAAVSRGRLTVWSPEELARFSEFDGSIHASPRVLI